MNLKMLLDKVDFDQIKKFDISSLSTVFFQNSVVAYIVGIVLIYLFLKILKTPFKILKKVIANSIIGYAILYILMMFKIVIVPFTYISYFLVGSFGIVGIILSYLFYM